MWLVDSVMAFVSEGGPFLEISAYGTGVGLSALALGLVMWLVRLVASDRSPLGRARAACSACPLMPPVTGEGNPRGESA